MKNIFELKENFLSSLKEHNIQYREEGCLEKFIGPKDLWGNKRYSIYVESNEILIVQFSIPDSNLMESGYIEIRTKSNSCGFNFTVENGVLQKIVFNKSFGTSYFQTANDFFEKYKNYKDSKNELISIEELKNNDIDSWLIKL